jgi:hypothetical protein
MTDEELIERLRSACFLAFDDGTNDYGTAPDAADRIEQLVKENSDLKRRCVNTEAAVLPLVDEREQAEAYYEAERLEAALLELVTCVEDGCFCSEMKMATAIEDARAALKGTDHE